MRKPFVYFSEAVLTPTHTVDNIEKLCASLGGRPSMTISSMWEQHALSVSRQSQLFRTQGFRGEVWHSWLNTTVEGIADSVNFPSQANRKQFVNDITAVIGRPNNYYVPSSVRTLLSQFAEYGIGWGILSNESHLYHTVLATHRVMPHGGPFLNASVTGLFKPLPSLWRRAVQVVPVASKNDIWFVGSVKSPCDKLCASPLVKCILIDPGITEAEPVSMHFRLPNLGDLLPLLLHNKPNLAFLNDPLNQLEDDDDNVILTSYPALPLPPKSHPDIGIAQLRKKSDV